MNNGLNILAQGVVTNNIILLQGLGLYALTRYTRDVKTAVKSGVTMICAMLTAALVVWAFQGAVIDSLSVEIGFYLLVGTLSALAWQNILGFDGSLEKGLVDSALVGLLLIMGRDGIAGPTTVGFALSAGLGYLLVLIVMATLRKRLELAPIPKPLRGAPIVLITAGLLAIALMGFRL
ncbi:MAG: hypothetical protein GX331_05805 [Firmicutes bacterium]|nr:hypothetical protein [Bacillota bacterium]